MKTTPETQDFNLSPARAMEAGRFLCEKSPPVMYHPLLADRLGNMAAALIVCQSLYWLQRSKRRGHFWKSVDEWSQELRIGRAAILHGLRAAIESGVLLARTYTGKSTHYSVDMARLKSLFKDDAAPCIDPCENRTGQYSPATHAEIAYHPCENSIPPMRKSHTTHAKTEQVNTETTTEITTETTQPSGGVSLSPNQEKTLKRIAEKKRLIEQALEINTPESLRNADRWKTQLAELEAGAA